MAATQTRASTSTPASGRRTSAASTGGASAGTGSDTGPPATDVEQLNAELERTGGAPGAPRPKSITIGAVCKALAQEFPDISISKIRYLEDQKLLTPRRTPGGYRLYTQADVARLRTILRMQRDEFLPLRVIRQELAAGRGAGVDSPAGAGADADGTEAGGARGTGGASSSGASAGRAARRMRPWRTSVSVRDSSGALYSLEDVLEETGAEAGLVRELEEYGVVRGELRGSVRYFDETEREIIGAVSELARYGVGGRNLRVFRSSADREATLLQQILAPALRSRNPQRRKEAVDTLENLAAVATHLKHLLLVRDLRKIVR
jgi:DNA-binding transcriptional MerR regulator